MSEVLEKGKRAKVASFTMMERTTEEKMLRYVRLQHNYYKMRHIFYKKMSEI